MSALDTQVGGDHYRTGSIQPIQYIEANSLQFLEASVVKRVTRHNQPTGKGRQDIEKAIHELQLLLELRYAATGGTLAPDATYRVGEQATDYAIDQATHMDREGNLCREAGGTGFLYRTGSWAEAAPTWRPEFLHPLKT